MVKVYIQATDNIFTATPHKWKEIKDFNRGKREVDNIIKFIFEVRVRALMTKLGYIL